MEEEEEEEEERELLKEEKEEEEEEESVSSLHAKLSGSWLRCYNRLIRVVSLFSDKHLSLLSLVSFLRHHCIHSDIHLRAKMPQGNYRRLTKRKNTRH